MNPPRGQAVAYALAAAFSNAGFATTSARASTKNWAKFRALKGRLQK
jgi:hypothetical protein